MTECAIEYFLSLLSMFLCFSVEPYGIYIALIFVYTDSALGLCYHFCEDLSFLL